MSDDQPTNEQIAKCPYNCGGVHIYAVKRKRPNNDAARWQIQCGYIECYYQSSWRETEAEGSLCTASEGYWRGIAGFRVVCGESISEVEEFFDLRLRKSGPFILAKLKLALEDLLMLKKPMR